MPEEYNTIFNEALEHLLIDYKMGHIRLLSERDLQSHLFSHCIKLMKTYNYPKPWLIYTEKSVFKSEKVDLVLGNDEVLVELKLEPDYPGVSKPVVFTTIQDAGGSGSGSIEYDILKIKKYADLGKIAHLVVIDEDGMHKRKLNENWIETTSQGKPRYILHTQFPKLKT